MCIVMETHIVHLSNLLEEIPAFTRVAAIYGTQVRANGPDGLSIRHPNGTETIHTLPIGSQPWLRTVFPWYGERVEVGIEADSPPLLIRVFYLSGYTDDQNTQPRTVCLGPGHFVVAIRASNKAARPSWASRFVLFMATAMESQ